MVVDLGHWSSASINFFLVDLEDFLELLNCGSFSGIVRWCSTRSAYGVAVGGDMMVWEWFVLGIFVRGFILFFSCLA